MTKDMPKKKDDFEYFSIANENELGEGERLFVEIENLNIVIIKKLGKVYALGDICSHDDGPLGDGEIDDHVIKCPRHGATFDIQTGKVLSLPAIVDIPAFPVKIEKGEILVGIHKEK